MNNPKVLVLMAAYNGEKYIEKQLDSIFAQKGVDVEVLVRDDGSSDRTVEIIRAYEEKHALKWFSDKHLNVNKGFFELMRHAKDYDADFFAFADQDDVWDEDKLAIGANAIKGLAVPALYYCGQRLVDEDLNFIEDHVLNKERSLKTRFVLSDFAGCTGVFNRALLEEVIKYEPEYMLSHDTWILRVCLGIGGEVVVDSCSHMDYRQHGGNSIGLRHNLMGNLRQVRQYLYVYKVQEVTQELVKGYGERLVAPYKDLAEWICGYQTNKSYRDKLLDKANVDFCNRGLNLTYRLKILLKRL